MRGVYPKTDTASSELGTERQFSRNLASVSLPDGFGTTIRKVNKDLRLSGKSKILLSQLLILCCMRPTVDAQKIKRLMQILSREAQGAGCIYFTGGASALLIGWRSSTVDVDIRLDPEPPGIFQAIAKLKQELNINIELASPQDFLPPLPGWRDRSVFIGKQGQISFYHYDFTAQALSKLSRGFERDLSDVQAMYEQKLFSLEELRNSFEAIAPELIRFPSLKPDVLRSRVENFIKRFEDKGENQR